MTKNRGTYIDRWLSEDERELIMQTPGLNASDFRTLAKVAHILSDPDLASRFNQCRANDFQHYMIKQLDWTAVEQWVIGQKVDKGLSERVKTLMFIEDFDKYHNGTRFKIFYCLKYPDKVTWN